MLYRFEIEVVLTHYFKPTINYDISRVHMVPWTGLEEGIHLTQTGFQPRMNFGTCGVYVVRCTGFALTGGSDVIGLQTHNQL